MAEEKAKPGAVGEEKVSKACRDRNCPFHGSLAARGRSFKGYVTRIHDKRATIEFKRFIFSRKYERYARKITRLHAHLPACLAEKVKIGSYVKTMECRPLSKLIHHVVVGVEK